MTEEKLPGWQTAENEVDSVDHGIDLFELFTLFAVQWRRILTTALIVFLVGMALILHIKPLFEADASLLPQSKSPVSGLASVLGSPSSATVFLALLKSRTVADEVIDSQHLMQVYQVKSRELARQVLAGNSVFALGTDSLITLKVRDKDALRAKQLCDAYLSALADERAGMLRQEASVQDEFFREQTAGEAEALAKAEQQLQSAQESTGVLQPQAQTVLGLSSIEQLRGQVASLEVQLSSLLTGASEQNPRVKSLRAQLAELRSEERARESAPGSYGAGAAASARNMPALNLDVARKERDVKFHEILLTSIATHYETARLSSVTEIQPYSVVDRGVVPERKAWPPRLLLTIADMFFSLFVGLVAAGVAMLWRKLLADPVQRQRIASIRESFRFSPQR